MDELQHKICKFGVEVGSINCEKKINFKPNVSQLHSKKKINEILFLNKKDITQLGIFSKFC